jgi:hypothetical protein
MNALRGVALLLLFAFSVLRLASTELVGFAPQAPSTIAALKPPEAPECSIGRAIGRVPQIARPGLLDLGLFRAEPSLELPRTLRLLVESSSVASSSRLVDQRELIRQLRRVQPRAPAA